MRVGHKEWDSASAAKDLVVSASYDRNGNDRYQAGEFSQGVGYFFALGVLYDRSGDDAYRADVMPKAQVPIRPGVLFDERGNDRYRAKTAAGQGAGWDVDRPTARQSRQRLKGQDTSKPRSRCDEQLGSPSRRTGTRSLRSTQRTGIRRSAKYWGGRKAKNLGGLIDTGDQPDQYNQIGRSNEHTVYSPGIGLFRPLDARASATADAELGTSRALPSSDLDQRLQYLPL